MLDRILREPFRIFFLCGLLAGFAGVLVWPLYYFGVLESVKNVLHMRLQIEGFLGSFVIGFLMTALPRILGAPPCTKGELLSFVLLFLSTIAFHISGIHAMGDFLFGTQLIMLLIYGLKRFSFREDLPPPFFVLIPIGMLHALSGVGILLLIQWGHGSRFLGVGQGMLHLGFVLCLVLGIGSFLGPRFLGFDPSASPAESRTPSTEWKWKASFFAAAGLLIYASFWLEYAWPTPGAFMRAIVASVVLLRQIPIYRAPRAVGVLPHALRLAFFFILLGLWGMALAPTHRVAMLHIVLIGGFSLTTLIVATRVIFGHSGWEYLFQTRMKFLGLVTLLIATAMVLRVVADYFSGSYFQILSWASLAWLSAGIFWAIVTLPKILFPKPETED